MTLDAATYPALLEENVKLRAERDALAAELSRLRRLEEAAIEWNQRREPFMREPTMETAALIDAAVKALVTAAREAEKARNA